MPKTVDEVIDTASKIQELRKLVKYKKGDVSTAKRRLDGFVEKSKGRVCLCYFNGLDYENLYDSDEKPSADVINAIIADLNRGIKERKAHVIELENKLQELEDSLLK